MHGDFITTSGDWRSVQNVNLWQGVNGMNNPCPSGYRLPTETEVDAEHLTWSSDNAAGAFGSVLKWPMNGARITSSGALHDVGTGGGYWSSTVSGTDTRHLGFNAVSALMYTTARGYGFAVRCIKN